MAELGAAWVGLAGVRVGAVVTQAADELRWRRERRARESGQLQAVLIGLLRTSSEIVGGAGVIVDTAAPRPGLARVTIDLTGLDRAVVALGQHVDELRVLGPRSLIEPAVDFFDMAVDIRDAAARQVSSQELRHLAEKLYDLKQALLSAAAEVGLVHR